MRKPATFCLAALITLLAACGGGGGSSYNPTPPPPPPPGQVIATPGAPNVEPITVDAGPAALSVRAVNIPYITLTICAPGSAVCEQIDHVEVDTGSVGLRILGSVLNIALPPVSAPGGLPIAECTQFADGASFGPLAVADLQLTTSTKQVSGLAIQVIGASNYQTVPGDCPGIPQNTVQLFGANGILGVGPFIQDCGAACADAINFPHGYYYTCPTPATCAAAAIATAQQVSNPVSFFSSDNNGVIVELPAVANSGAASVAGSLVFGINTRSNNALGTATVLTATKDLAYVQATYGVTTLQNAALDSGSNATFFNDGGIPACTQATGLYCPNSTLSLSATLRGTNSNTLAAPFTVANAESLLNANPTASVLPGFGGKLPASATGSTIQFDLGLPFYFGRNVFTGIEGQLVGSDTGPLYAF